MKAGSVDYDGGLPRVAKPKLTLKPGQAVAQSPSRGKNSAHGVGARVKQCYCPTCGQKRAACRCEEST